MAELRDKGVWIALGALGFALAIPSVQRGLDQVVAERSIARAAHRSLRIAYFGNAWVLLGVGLMIVAFVLLGAGVLPLMTWYQNWRGIPYPSTSHRVDGRRVDLTIKRLVRVGLAFHCRVIFPDGTYVESYDAKVGVVPGDTRTFHFPGDFDVRERQPLPPGRYRVMWCPLVGRGGTRDYAAGIFWDAFKLK